MVHLDTKSVFAYMLYIKRKINMQNHQYVYSNENKLLNMKVERCRWYFWEIFNDS